MGILLIGLRIYRNNLKHCKQQKWRFMISKWFPFFNWTIYFQLLFPIMQPYRDLILVAFLFACFFQVKLDRSTQKKWRMSLIFGNRPGSKLSHAFIAFTWKTSFNKLWEKRYVMKIEFLCILSFNQLPFHLKFLVISLWWSNIWKKQWDILSFINFS